MYLCELSLDLRLSQMMPYDMLLYTFSKSMNIICKFFFCSHLKTLITLVVDHEMILQNNMKPHKYYQNNNDIIYIWNFGMLL